MAANRQEKYLRMFKDELCDHVEVITSSLAAFEDNQNTDVFEEVVRRLHTIKGSAYMIGLSLAGELAHRVEDILKEAHGCEGHECDPLVGILYEAMDVLVPYVGGLTVDDLNSSYVSDELTVFFRYLDTVRASSQTDESLPLPSDKRNQTIELSGNVELTDSLDPPAQKSACETSSGSGGGQSEGTVRVDIVKLDKLLELASELVTFQARLTAKTSQLPFLSEDMVELGYLVEDIHLQTMEARMLPVSTIIEDFFRTLRTVSRELGKETVLIVTGKTVEVDKRILELVRPVIIHTLRNAVDHGIELPEDRLKAGKDEKGTISLKIVTDGTFITFTIIDDGKGVDIEKLSEKAISMGLIKSADVAVIPKQKLLELMFETGLSTAGHLSSISGRGVGMDVVKRSVEEMKGTLSIESESGSGTTVSFSVPTSLSVVNALMVEAGDETYAIPMSVVVETVRFTSDDIINIGTHSGINLRGDALVLSYLPTLIGFSDIAMPPGGKFNAVVIKNSSERLALVIDNILGDEDIVVKTLGNHIKSIRYVSGATFLPSGKPALILQVSELFYSSFIGDALPINSVSQDAAPAKILIIDDSRTTQMMETSILEAAGFKSHAVSSAEEAIEYLEDAEPFDLFVIDIEMPGMNGIELIQWMNTDGRFHNIPKILLSSASSHEGWELAGKLGVSACIKKQDFNQEIFLKTIRKLLRLG